MNFSKYHIIPLILGIFILGLFFCFYNYFNINNNYNPPVFNSPDETSNYFFVKNFAENSSISKKLNYNSGEISNVSNLIHPRSITVNNFNLIPISFIGLILIYGLIAKIFGLWIIQYLTPIFSIIAIIFLYLLLKKVFNKKIAIISSILTLINPGFWYFSSKLLMHNMLFISLLIISYYFLILSTQNKKIISFILWGFFLGLSLITRTSEFLWVLLSIILILIFYKVKINYKILLAFLMFIFVFVPVFYFNKIHNASYFQFSYADNIDTSVVSSQISSTRTNILTKTLSAIFPFGINIKNILYVIYHFFLKLNWIFCLLLFLGLLILFIKRKNISKKDFGFIILWFLISGYLFIYYGSWKISDTAIVNSITIGSSYIRYLLAFFILSNILIAISINKLKNDKLTIIIISIIMAIFANISHSMVYDSNIDGEKMISKNISKFYNLKKLIIEKTEDNAIIFTNRSDKFIFPERNVVFLYDYDIYNYENLEKFRDIKIPLYYFDNKKELKNTKQNIELESIFISGEYFLYKINFTDET
ncbi:MAG: glycosyltransferase family 39 protein [Patescibacteria group bacterium]|nr:glycosyltransferase family 39 protein [Patescibacteria group bacterium]